MLIGGREAISDFLTLDARRWVKIAIIFFAGWGLMASSLMSCSRADREKGDQMIEMMRAADFRKARALLADGAYPDARDDQTGATALTLACMEGRLDMVAALLDHHADPDRPDAGGRTPLQMACLVGKPMLVRLLLEHDAEVNTRNRDGETPLINAAAGGRLEIAAMLLANGAKVNAHGPNGMTALMFAAFGDPEMVALLLQNGADINARDHDGNTALICASGPFSRTWETDDGASNTLRTLSGNAEVVRLLVSAGADVNVENDAGYTAWSLAASSGYDKIAGLLKSSGARPAGRRMDVNAVFRMALELEQLDMARSLLERGADVDHRNESGSTPLMLAAYNGKIEVARMLLDAGADPTVKNQHGYTALDYARERNHPEIARMFEAPADGD